MIIGKDWFDNVVVRMSPDEGAGGAAAAAGAGDAGAAGAGDAGAQDAKFTQAQVNKILADHKRNLRKELDDVRAEISSKDLTITELHERMGEYDKTLGELKKFSVQKAGDSQEDKNRPLADIVKDATAKLSTVDETIKNLKEEYDGRVSALEGDLTKERSLREIAEEEALISERDVALSKALTQAGCRDDAIEVAIKTFDDMIEIDTDTGQWYFVNDKTGEEWPLTEGVVKNLPAYMRKPMSSKGGAGSFGSTTVTDEAQVTGRIATLDAEIDKLQDEYNKTRNTSLVTKVQRLMREKRQLEREHRLSKV